MQLHVFLFLFFLPIYVLTSMEDIRWGPAVRTRTHNVASYLCWAGSNHTGERKLKKKCSNIGCHTQVCLSIDTAPTL